ncbi:hemicentin-2 [Patella vulgata]|uniref:hemicentin-2 n=1 Tax=Patella vulgata TaxID=6465 RepID=UPI00217FB62D|nr:hemicentin-2 [Patella vulgata]
MTVSFIYLSLLVSVANACEVICEINVKPNEAVDLILNLTNVETKKLVQLRHVPNDRIVSLGTAGAASEWKDFSRNNNTRTNAHSGAIVTVTLLGLTRNDAGKYCCDEGVTGCGTNLIVSDKPVINLTQPDRQPLLEKGVLGIFKGEINLTCNAVSTTKPDNHNLTMGYTWFKNGVIYGNGKRLHDNEVDITYKEASIVCVATDYPHCKKILQQLNHFSTIETVNRGECSSVVGFSEKFIVHPEYGPYSIKLQPDRGHIKPIVGSDLSVDCTSDCNPPCDIKWYKDGDVLSNNKHINIPDLQLDDDGVYMCIASNTYGNRNTSFNIDLSYAPVQKRRAGDDIIETVVGEMVTASRGIFGYPKPVVDVASIITPSSVSLYYTNYTVHATHTTHYYRLTLSVHVVTDDYLGKYCVYVENKKGKTHICHTLTEGITITDEEPVNMPVLGLGICLGVVILVFSVIIMVLVIKFHKDKRRLRLSEHGYYYIGDTSDKSSVSV